MKNIFLIKDKNINKNFNYSLNENAPSKKRFLVFLLDFALFFILFSLIQGIFTNQIGFLIPSVSNKISEINESRGNLYKISESSSLLEIEDNNLISFEDTIYKEIRRSLKTYLVGINYEFKGNLYKDYEIFDDYSEENINFYLFNYRLNNITKDKSKNDEFILELFNKYFINYYENNFLETNYFLFKEEVALKLTKYIFEEDYSNEYSSFYNEYLDNYSLFYNELIKDFESNDSNYNLSFSDFKKLNDEYYIYLIYELFISYTLAFIIYFLIPLLIFKKDQTLMMKMFKLVGANKKTNLNLKFINYLTKFILLYLIFLFSLLIFIFLFYFSYLNMIFIGFINIFNISIFSFLLLLINMFLPLLNKKHYSLINLGSNEIIKKSDEFINEMK